MSGKRSHVSVLESDDEDSAPETSTKTSRKVHTVPTKLPPQAPMSLTSAVTKQDIYQLRAHLDELHAKVDKIHDMMREVLQKLTPPTTVEKSAKPPGGLKFFAHDV